MLPNRLGEGELGSISFPVVARVVNKQVKPILTAIKSIRDVLLD
jgi:hypothetical protein